MQKLPVVASDTVIQPSTDNRRERRLIAGAIYKALIELNSLLIEAAEAGLTAEAGCVPSTCGPANDITVDHLVIRVMEHVTPIL